MARSLRRAAPEPAPPESPRSFRVGHGPTQRTTTRDGFGHSLGTTQHWRARTAGTRQDRRMTVRVGLIGAGAVGARHARTLAGFGGVELIGGCDTRPAARGAVGAELGIPVVDSPGELLRRRPDAVWLCVPPFAHGDLESALVRAGLPFFVEKPLAADVRTAEQAARAVASAALPTATGYHWRHLDTVEHARAVLGERPVRLAGARWWGATPPPVWWSSEHLSGGQVVEQATHVIERLRVLVGEVYEVVGGAAPPTVDGR